MSLTELLTHAAEERPRYFSPGFDIEIYHSDQEEWRPAIASEHSLDSLAEGLQSGDIDNSRVRFSNDGAEEYLNHLHHTGIADEIHHDELLDREQLIDLADARYITPEDFIGTDDPVDIEAESGVDRDIIQKVASKHISGFSSGGSFGSGPLDTVEPRDDFEGWELVSNSDTRIRWRSSGRFRLTVKPTPSGGITIATNAPNEERTAWYRKGWAPSINGAGEGLSADEALEVAHDWIEAHELQYEDDLAKVPRIGPSTKDYLGIEHGVTSLGDLRTFVETHPEEVEELFGDEAATVIDHLDSA